MPWKMRITDVQSVEEEAAGLMVRANVIVTVEVLNDADTVVRTLTLTLDGSESEAALLKRLREQVQRVRDTRSLADSIRARLGENIPL